MCGRRADLVFVQSGGRSHQVTGGGVGNNASSVVKQIDKRHAESLPNLQVSSMSRPAPTQEVGLGKGSHDGTSRTVAH